MLENKKELKELMVESIEEWYDKPVEKSEKEKSDEKMQKIGGWIVVGFSVCVMAWLGFSVYTMHNDSDKRRYAAVASFNTTNDKIYCKDNIINKELGWKLEGDYVFTKNNKIEWAFNCSTIEFLKENEDI